MTRGETFENKNYFNLRYLFSFLIILPIIILLASQPDIGQTILIFLTLPIFVGPFAADNALTAVFTAEILYDPTLFTSPEIKTFMFLVAVTFNSNWLSLNL